MAHKLLCENCGSDNISFGAYASWNMATQTMEYELADHTDYDWCFDCAERVIDVQEVELTDLKDIALVAAHTPIFKSVRSNPDANCVHR